MNRLEELILRNHASRVFSQTMHGAENRINLMRKLYPMLDEKGKEELQVAADGFKAFLDGMRKLTSDYPSLSVEEACELATLHIEHRYKDKPYRKYEPDLSDYKGKLD